VAISSIILRIRREGEQAIPATARDLRGLATTAQAAGRSLQALQGIQIAGSAGGIQAQATALQGLTQGANQAQQAFAGLAAAQTRASAAAPNTAQAAAGIQGVGTAATRAQAGVTSLAVAQQRLATEQQRTALTSQRVATELQRTEAAAIRAAAAKQRLATASTASGAAIQRNAQGLAILPRTIAGLEGAAASFATTMTGAFAGAFAVQNIASFTGEAVRAANQLEDVQSSLRIIAQDAGTYDRALAAATASQRLFGGSLADNISDVQSFVLTSRTAGVALEDLITVSRQLATLDPGQGLRGANIALRELLSGNPNSLAMRFELPRKTLRALTSESATTADKLAALSTYLEDAGLSAEAVTARLDNTSQSFRNLAAGADQAQASIGSLIARGLAPLADSTGAALLGVAALAQRLNGQGNQFTAAAAGAAAASESYDAYAARIAATNAQIDAAVLANQRFAGTFGPLFSLIQPFVGATLNLTARTHELSEAQFLYVRALQAGGTEGGAAVARAQTQAAALATLQTAFQTSGGALDQYKPRLVAAAAASNDNLRAITSLVTAYQAGQIGPEQFATTLAAIEATTRRVTVETGMAAFRQAEYNTANDASIQTLRQAAEAANADAAAKIDQAAQADLARARQEQLNRELERAAASGEPVADAAARIAAVYTGVEAPAIERIIGLLREKNALQNVPAPQVNKVPPALRPGFGGGPPADVARAQQAANEAAEARRQQLLATGSAAQVAALREKEYAQAVKLFGASSTQAIGAQTDLIQARERAAAEATRAAAASAKADKATATAGTKGLDAGFRADLKLEEDSAGRMARLEEERRRLEAQGLTNTTRYKQVLVEIKKEQEGIAAAAEKAASAELNRLQAGNRARIAAVEDARKRREEDQQAISAREILARAEFSPEQKARAQERLQLIELEREQRALAIEEARRAAGEAPGALSAPASVRPFAAPQGATPPAVGPVAVQADAVQLPAALQAQLIQITAASVQVSGGGAGALPLQAAPTAPGVTPPAPAGVGQPITVILTLDGRELQRVTLPGVTGILSAGIQAALATGGGG
jgi:hypothetical protein